MTYHDQESQVQAPLKPLLLLDTGGNKQQANRFAKRITYGITALDFEEAALLYPQRCILYYIQDTVENIIFYLPYLHPNTWQIIGSLPPEPKTLKPFLLYSHALISNEEEQSSWLNHLQYAYDYNYYIHPVFHKTVLKELTLLEKKQSFSREHVISVNQQKASRLLLTKTEIRVLSVLGEGKSNLAMANTLNVRESTLNNHMNNINKKLQVTSKMQAIRKCFQQGIFILSTKEERPSL